MKKFCLIFFILLSAHAAWAQENVQVNQAMNQEIQNLEEQLAESKEVQPAAAPVPEKPVEQADPQELAWRNKHADQPYIALLNEYETTIKPDWSYEETYHARIKIQKEAGKELGQWPIYYNKSRDVIAEVQAHVETLDGRKWPATNVQDVEVYSDFPMYSDMRMKVVTLPQVNVGSVIDVQVKSTTSRKEISNQFWGEVLYPAIPTLHAKHSFIFSDDKPVQFKAYKTEYKPTVEKTDGRTKYSFIFNETDPIPDDEELMPPLQEVLGGFYLSSMSDWKTIADWYRELIHKNTIEDVDIMAKAIALTKDKTSQKDKARAILEFIQDEFRYVGMNFGDNTVEPHPTKDVFKNRYGDCKDLSLLTKQMLKIAGIESNISLFSEELAGNPEAGLPNPSVFSHIVLQTNLDGQDYYVDPQLKGFDFGQFPSTYDNAHVLVIDETGFKFDHLPIPTEEEHALVSEADITINGTGSANFRVHVKLPIQASQSFRQSWGSSTNEDKDKFFENLEQNFAKNGKMIDRTVKGVENRYGPVQFELRYESPNAYPLVNDMILIREEDQSDAPNFAQEHRKNPIFVSSNSIVRNKNVYHVPDGFKITFVPANYSLSVDLMDVNVSYEQKDNTAEINSTYRTKRCNIPIDRYAQVRDFRKELFKKVDQYIILKKMSDISPEAKDFLNKEKAP